MYFFRIWLYLFIKMMILKAMTSPREIYLKLCLRHSLSVYFGMRSHQNKGCTELASCYLPRFFFNGVSLLYLCVIITFPLFSRVFRRIFHECLQDLVFSRFVFNSKSLFRFRDSYFVIFSWRLFFLSWYFDKVMSFLDVCWFLIFILCLNDLHCFKNIYFLFIVH